MRKVLVVLLAAIALVAASCASDGGSKATPRRASTTTVVRSDPASVPKAPSPGCDGPALQARAGEMKQEGHVLGGPADVGDRWWFRRVPPAHDGRTPVPLVMDLHGYSEGAAIHEQLSGLGRFGDEHGFVTLTPQGQGPVARWDTTLGSADLTFLGLVLRLTEEQLCVDRNREYVTGLSNGAFMTSAMACQYSERIAAVAPVAGVRNIAGCAPKRPVPIVAFHGTADGFVSYDGGLGKKALDLPAADGSGRTLRDTLSPDQLDAKPDPKGAIPNIMAAWAKRNGCQAGDTATKVAADVTKLTWHCAAAGATVLYRVTGGGHAWPGSPVSAGIEGIVGHTTMSIDADDLMWRFFVDHPLTHAK